MPAGTQPPTSALTSPSPLLLEAHEMECLAQSDGFTILREHLAEHYTYE